MTSRIRNGTALPELKLYQQFEGVCCKISQLGMGYNSGTLNDLEEAANIAPMCPQAYFSQSDASMTMEKENAAEIEGIIKCINNHPFNSSLKIIQGLYRNTSREARHSRHQTSESQKILSSPNYMFLSDAIRSIYCIAHVCN
ncbi:hypothetical protein J5N97_029028 [Dioscorea zingiberensis]|uniref:Uncharacterized protein n=1 Tax=Dioscorea zingiberensis TaxID=325984 RepID=A0A9D5BZJ2_9LILI|nr:hypothetical protein J5N97_029028 [Dioscorea zingiberensis]